MDTRFLVDPPGWVTREFIEEALRKCSGDENLNITQCEIKGASYRGDNYSSIVSRASCRITSKCSSYQKTMIIKTMPVSVMAVEFVKQNKSFETEILMMNEVVPAIEKILQGVGYAAVFAPKLYYSALEPEPIIIMEDLCDSGFAIQDRFTGLNLNQCLSTLKAMAAFHAGSLQYISHHPEMAKSLPKGHWGSSNQSVTEHFIVSNFKSLIGNIDDWCDEKWATKLSKFLTKLPRILYETVDNLDPKTLPVINHGDVWTTNLMFRESINLDLRFIDYQVSFCQSPVFDVMYFLIISPHEEIRFNKWEEMLHTYHTHFLEVCALLNITIDYSFEKMIEEFKKNIIFGFFVAFTLFALFIAPRDDALDHSKEDPYKESKVHLNPIFQSCFPKMLHYFEKMGLFEQV